MKYLLLAGALLCLFSINAEARQRHRDMAVSSECNRGGTNSMPCENVTTSPRGERVVRAMRGFGAAKKVYRPDSGQSAVIVPHPISCPRVAFCGCGAAVRVFGHSVRELWLAANWFKFPRAAPGVGMVAVRRGHVFVLESHIDGNIWLAWDANSGHHLTQIHPRSIVGYVIVNPHGAST